MLFGSRNLIRHPRDAAAGSQDEVERIVRQIRAVWPAVRIIVRADSGLCREQLMRWCEDSGVSYVVGFARNQRLRKIIEPRMQEAARLYQQTGSRPASGPKTGRSSCRHGRTRSPR